MRTTCLINSYNYRPFIAEAVRSALDQSQALDEIVIVDDGSTDGSLEHLQSEFAGHSKITIISKPNAGQLSCFNEGLKHVTGDILFFLDADDRYRPNYVEEALQAFDSEQCDMTIAGIVTFGQPPDIVRPVPPRRDLGYSILSTYLTKTYVGAQTSSLAMRRDIASQLLPYPYEAEWRVRADDVLVLGSSLVGGHKFHLGMPLVEQRLHAKNCFSGSTPDVAMKLLHGLALERLIHWHRQRSDFHVPDLAHLLHREFGTIEQPTWREFRTYLSMSFRSRLTLRQRGRHCGAMTAHYLNGRRRRSATHLVKGTTDKPSSA